LPSNLPIQLQPLLLDEAVKLIQELAISLGNNVHYTCQHGLHLICSTAQQAIDDIFSDSLLQLL
jgi:hypothetical protein